MKLINVSEIVNLKACVRGVVAAAINEITENNKDYRGVEPFTQVLSVDGHRIRAAYTPIPTDGNTHAHDCGRQPAVGVLNFGLPAGGQFEVRFEAEDFGKRVDDEVIDELTKQFMHHLSYSATDKYLMDNFGEAITKMTSEFDLDGLEKLAEGLVRISFSGNSHNVLYRSPEGDVRFEMNYADNCDLHGMTPEFHQSAAVSGYVRCMLDAMVNGFIFPEIQVTLSSAE